MHHYPFCFVRESAYIFCKTERSLLAAASSHSKPFHRITLYAWCWWLQLMMMMMATTIVKKAAFAANCDAHTHLFAPRLFTKVMPIPLIGMTLAYIHLFLYTLIYYVITHVWCLQYIPIIMTLYHAAAIMKNFYDRTSIAHFMFNRYHRDHQVHQNGPVYNFIAFPDYLHTNKLLLVRGSVLRPNAYTRRASAR